MTVTFRPPQKLQDWLLKEGARLELPAMISSLAHQLVALGLQLDRFSIGFGLLNPQLLAASIVWRPNQSIEFVRYGYEQRNSGMYERSPFKVARETGRWVHIDVPNTPDEAFGIVPDLRAEGLVHYYAIPVFTSSGGAMSVTIATSSADDFTEAQKQLLRDLLPALTVVAELKTLGATFRDVLGAYVGRGPAQQIIDGTVHRGEVTHVRAAIFVADLRGFTHLSTQLPPEATADLINRYYDAVVPHVSERHGEVLKFIGDAVLAIFPAEHVGDAAATLTALHAARMALDADVPPFEVDGRKFPIRFGIAVHFGEAVFGNVGSGDRLDFTVIGRDVNLAARIASLCSRLGRDYLVSQEVAAIGRAHGRMMTDAGAHEVRGIDNPIQVFVPDITEIGPNIDDGISQGLLLAPTA